MRKAPAGFLRKLEATEAVPDDVDDDEWLPFTRLLIQMPPRHGKSVHVSQYFAAWYLGRHPTHHVILTTYGDGYAATWGRKARDVLRKVGWEAFGVQVTRGKSASHDWELEGHAGGMMTAGTGGAITGRGGNCLIGDDLVKGAKEASSEVIQERNWDWWQSEATTRLEADDEGLEPIVVLIGTRWNDGDVTGRILDNIDELEEADVWYSLRLPALAEENDPLGREPGEALWPARRTLSFLNRLKGQLSAYWWSALFQQRPTPELGNIFLRNAWQYYDEAPAGYYPGYIFVDTAGWKDSKKADYGAWAAVIRVGKDLIWLGARHGRWTFPQFVQELKDAHDTYGLPIGVEDTPWARPIIQTLGNEIEGVVPIPHMGIEKEVRAQAASPYQVAGNFYLPRRGQWTKDFIDEHAAFPNGAHDDWVDTTSMAALRLLRATIPTTASIVDERELREQRRRGRREDGWAGV